MADVKRKYDRFGNARPVQDKADEINARFNGFVFDKAPTDKQAAAVDAVHAGGQK